MGITGTMKATISAVVVTGAVMMATATQAAPSAGDQCESGKNAAAGRYAACLARAEQSLVLDADARRYGAHVGRCETRLLEAWAQLEEDAAAQGASCPSQGDAVEVAGFIDACTSSVGDALAGGGLGKDPVSCNAGLAACERKAAAVEPIVGIISGEGTRITCASELGTCNASLGACTAALATCDAGTATAADVLSGETFSSASGRGISGTMTNRGAVTLIPTTGDQAIAAGYHDGSGKCAGDADLVAGNIKSGVDLFGVVGTAATAGLTRTGQTTCYDAGGLPVSCAGTGQDGDVQAGAARSFTDNGDGTVTDNTTGLVWEKLSREGGIHDRGTTYTWANAFSVKVATLNGANFAGHDDWRLPNLTELESLRNLAAVSPATYTPFNSACTAGCTTATCSCTSLGRYWTSSSYLDGPAGAWGVDYSDGKPFTDSKASTYGVRVVRTGP